MEETEEGQLRRAFQIGLRLKNSGLDEEVIYARIEKQGISADVARKVAREISVERIKDHSKNALPFYNSALAKIGLGVLGAIISIIIVPGQVVIPIGFIMGGIVSAIILKKKTDS